MKVRLSFIALLAGILFAPCALSAQATAVALPQAASVAFCGVVSKDAEGSMVKMTEDLYYTQLGSIDGVEVVDRRKIGFAQDYLASGGADFPSVPEAKAFYALISKESADRWNCAFCLYSTETKAVTRVEKAYDSYYKILMENKGVLLASFKTLLDGGGERESAAQRRAKEDAAQGAPLKPKAQDTASLAGTWIGEDGVEKAVILKGGRGFVIFQNGATMNIKVETEDGGRVVITQAGRSNASFFPELPREVALNLASSAEPIVWILSFDEAGALTGEKHTLVASGKGAKAGSVAVTWRRAN